MPEDWLDQLSPEEEEEWEKFVEHTRRHTIEGMDKSAFVMSLVPTRENLDIKFAVELGLSVMLDKPILAVVTPGVKVPKKLLQVVDQIVEADVDTEGGAEKIAAAIVEMKDKQKLF